MQCFYASKSMAEHTDAPGEDVTVTGPGSRIQVATSEDAGGDIEIDGGEAQAGVEYIDSQLEIGRPIVVGVSYTDKSYNVDAITDHFVTINGRRGEGKGATYTYLDPWATELDRAKGEFVCGSDHKLVAELGLLGRYEVAMVRRNA